MKLSDQVTSLELSRKLFDLGLKSESLFVWGNIRKYQLKAGLTPEIFSKHWLIQHCDHSKKHIQEAIDLGEILPAYTVAELLNILPHWIDINGIRYFFEIRKDCQVYYAEYCDSRSGLNVGGVFRSAEIADCLAKLLIYLIENNLLKL